jgi:putative hemolysin
MTVITTASAAAPEDGGMRTGFGELRGGSLGVRLATSEAEIDAAQALRYRVFYDEMGAVPTVEASRTHRDSDAFDAVADHLLVLDHAIGTGPEAVVATYRLIRQSAADRLGRFYSADEYDISSVVGFPGNVMELGRSCVHADYRGRAAMQLLWRGIAAYVFLHRIDLMFGCASLPGTDPDAIANELTYLYHNHLAPPAVRPRALPERYVDMRRVDPASLDARRTLVGLPPLIKGYLRLGGFVGDGAVIDQQFNTTDVAVVVKTDLVTDKYYRHYERQVRDALE